MQSTYTELVSHLGHRLECTLNGPNRRTPVLECLDCGVTLASASIPLREEAPEPLCFAVETPAMDLHVLKAFTREQAERDARAAGIAVHCITDYDGDCADCPVLNCRHKYADNL
jgi:hypothetical protein